MDGTHIYELIDTNTDESNIEAKQWIDDHADNLYQITYVHGENLLHWCGASNNFIICKHLLAKHDFAVNITNSRAASPLYYAASKDSFKVVKLLIEYGADIRDKSGFSGKYPHEICNNEEIKEYIQSHENLIPFDYDNGFVLKDNYTLTQAYNYRLIKYYNLILNMTMHKMNNVHTLVELDDKHSKKLLNNNTFDEILELYDDAIMCFQEDCNGHEKKKCLSCGTIGKLQKCGKCKKVYYCNQECQKKCHFLHKHDCN